MTPQLTTGRKAAALVVLLGAAVYFVLVEFHGRGTSFRPNMPATDIYAYFLPNLMYAARSVWQGGKGLLWNPLQSCGAPFFANPETALLYPPHLLFLVLDANVAVQAVLIINMVIGATGMFFLARELGLGWIAALGGALAFELGDPMAQFAGWSPTTNAPWAWVPWALMFCERLLRSPNRLAIVGLAAALALELLPGYPLIAALTYQLIAFRVAWELITRWADRPWRSAAAVVAGLALAPLLIAVQLVPAAELAHASIRALSSVDDMLRWTSFSPPLLLDALARRMPPLPFLVVPLLLAVVALLASAHRRIAIFYAVIGVLYGVLGLGDTTPLLRLYVLLPPGVQTLRLPHRLFWISGLSLTVLTAFGLQALVDRGDASRARWLLPIVAGALAATLYGLTPGGLRWPEAAALGGIVIAALLASVRPALGWAAAWVAVVALALNLVAVPLRWWGTLLPSADVLWRYRETFAALSPPITPQDRVFLMPASQLQLGFVAKTATVLGLHNLSDYDSLGGQRFTEYFTLMRTGAPFSGMMDAWRPLPWITPGVRRRLLDLAAVRYLVAPRPADVEPMLDVPSVPVSTPDLHVYANDAALPRARYVPRLEVVQDPAELVHRLAFGSDDLAQVAFVENALPSGFTGAGGAPLAGAVRFVQDDPEHLVIEVDAPARGFLVLADQYYPGWRATVNGVAVPIHRANYVFRLIEVPAGTSRVEFRYRPASVAIGAAISALTLTALAVLLWRGEAEWVDRARFHPRRDCLWAELGSGSG